jgi:hypothetical protein
MTNWKKTLYDNIQARKLVKQIETNEKDIVILKARPISTGDTTTVIGGNSFWGQVDGEYDYTQSTYYYVGGLDGATHKVNRYVKGDSTIKVQATGTWANRLTLIYT